MSFPALRPAGLATMVSLAVASSLLLGGCSGNDDGDDVSTDAAFLRDYQDDVENDLDEDDAEAREEAALDTFDELDDLPRSSPAGATSTDTGASADSTSQAVETAGRGRRTHGPLSIMQDDAYFFAAGDKVRSKAHFDEARGLGVNVIRMFVGWKDVVGKSFDPDALTRPTFDATNPANYYWDQIDRVFDGARAAGFRVLVTLASAIPAWASEDPAHCIGKPHCSYRPKPKEFAAFVTAVGRHFKARGPVWGWTIWNEPNLGFFLSDNGGTASTEDDRIAAGMRYRQLWFLGRKALRKTAGIKSRVFFGDMANGMTTPAHWTVLHYALCLPDPSSPKLPPCPARPRKIYTQGVAYHPYSPTPGGVGETVTRVEALLDVAASKGRISPNRPIYLTEHSFLVKGLVAPAPSVGLGGPGNVISPEQQAVYDNAIVRAMYDRPRVRSTAQFLLQDEGDGKWDSGLRHNDIINPNDPRIGEAKPAWYAYRLAIDVVKAGPGAVDVFGAGRACHAGFVVEGRGAAGWHELSAVTTDELGFGKKRFDSTGTSAWRLRCAGTIYSREAATP